jgi:hypothetical protein
LLIGSEKSDRFDRTRSIFLSRYFSSVANHAPAAPVVICQILKVIFVFPDMDLPKKRTIGENGVFLQNSQISKFCSLAATVVIFQFFGNFVFSGIYSLKK